MNFKYMRHRIATLRIELKLLFVIALFSILIIDLWLIKIPEKFPGGSALGGIYYKICLAYITAFLFYFLNVHIHSERTKVKSYKYINNKSVKILNLSNTVISSLREACGIPNNIKFPGKKNEISIICDYVDPRRPFTLGGWYSRRFPHWQAAAEYIAYENKELIRDLLFIRESLHPDVVEILMDLDDCMHIVNINHGQPVGNTDMEFYSSDLINYYNLCDKLMKTIRDKYKFHQTEYNENFRKNNKSQA